MSFIANNQGGMIQDQGGFQTLIVTESMLAEFEPSESNVTTAARILHSYFPEAIEARSLLNLDKEASKAQAYRHIIEAPSPLSDRLFMARVWFMTAETLLNRPVNRFKLRFPYIEGIEQ